MRAFVPLAALSALALLLVGCGGGGSKNPTAPTDELELVAQSGFNGERDRFAPSDATLTQYDQGVLMNLTMRGRRFTFFLPEAPTANSSYPVSALQDAVYQDFTAGLRRWTPDAGVLTFTRLEGTRTDVHFENIRLTPTAETDNGAQGTFTLKGSLSNVTVRPAYGRVSLSFTADGSTSASTAPFAERSRVTYGLAPVFDEYVIDVQDATLGAGRTFTLYIPRSTPVGTTFDLGDEETAGSVYYFEADSPESPNEIFSAVSGTVQVLRLDRDGLVMRFTDVRFTTIDPESPFSQGAFVVNGTFGVPTDTEP